MLTERLWSRERKRRKHRQRRQRKEHFGELVQLDGSFHPWLEERGPKGCLIDLADDATNWTWAQLGEQETIWAVADALRAWIEQHGVPLALYVDWKNLYKRAPTPRERLRGEEPMTQFGRMCAKLGIELIAASSPQAKGRIERMHGTHQDRLVKKLRRREIVSHEAANVYLRKEYLPEHNGRFARRAARPEDYHRRAPRAAELSTDSPSVPRTPAPCFVPLFAPRSVQGAGSSDSRTAPLRLGSPPARSPIGISGIAGRRWVGRRSRRLRQGHQTKNQLTKRGHF
ncbi:MAG: hypothetical protein ACRD4C_07725 [Candidatus Acidiferrales bacterium]